MMQACPLCGSRDTRHYHRDVRRDYHRCAECRLVFVPPAQRLTPAEEKAVYDQHENSPEDSGYRQFLSRLHTPLLARLPPAACGLDFGTGPGPTLSVMFEEVGHSMAIYDPFYAPDRSVLERQYDFITATEVVEHLFEPGRELERLVGQLRPDGWLGLMTKRVTTQQAFTRWHYILDPTHVVFFSDTTFEWLAHHLDMRLELPASDVALLQRKPG